jgi:hypothetical protein
VRVSEGLWLFHEGETIGVSARRHSKGLLISGANDDADHLHICPENLLDDDRQRRFCGTIAIHQRLQRQGPLGVPPSRDQSLFDFHIGAC